MIRPMSLYQTHVVAQCRKNPCLSILEKFLSEPEPERGTYQIASINFFSNRDGAIHLERETLQADELKGMLSTDKQSKKAKGRILIVEDISKDLVEFLGSSLNIDPLFFASHVYAAYRNTSMQTPDLALLPSRFQSQQYFNTHYHRTVQLRQKDECLGKKHHIRATNISRKLAILPPTHNISIGLVQHALSVHFFPQNDHREFWLCLILVDRSMPHGQLSLRTCDKGGNTNMTRLEIDAIPFLGGYEDFIDPSHPYTILTEAGLAPSRHGMLEDLIYYWNLKLPTDFDPTSPTLLSLCFYPLRIIAAEWANVLAVMNYHMKRYEYSVEGQRILGQDLDLLNTDLNSLQRWRRRNLSSQRKIDAISRFVTSQMASESQIDAEVPRNNSADCDYLVSDYAHLTSRLNQYSQRLESMLPVVMSLVQISDSRRSLAEAANISRLTYLAFVFVPLSFASSLFSMNPDTSPGGNHFWVYFAVALPITGAAFFIARPPCSLRLWRNHRVKSGISEV